MAKKNGNGSNGEELAVYQNGELPGVGLATTGEAMRDVLAGGEILPQVISLDAEGKYVEGIYEGRGQVVDYKDPDGEERALETHRFRLANGCRVDVIGSHQLNKALPDLVGHKVAVVKGPTKKVGAKQVNQFVISDKGAHA